MTEANQEVQSAEYDRILDTPMERNSAKATTIRGYFFALLDRILTEGELFSGKRPFGDSGWEWELYDGLAAAGVLKDAEYDEDNDLKDFDRPHADKLLRALAAHALRQPQGV